jgi:1-acyl-sn-glycerol-3-phosphate acyltransferase
MAIVRTAAREVVSLWIWGYLLTNTLVRFTIALFLSRFEDPKAAFGRWMHAWALGNMRWSFQTCRVEPHPPLPAPAVLLVNHQHFFDIELVTALVPPPISFVARVEVGGVPLIGSVIRHGGHLFVDRGGGRANETMLQEAVARLSDGGRVVFFGEGTRSKDGTIQTMRSGAFRLAARSGAPLVPVVLAGTRATFPRGYSMITPCRMAASFLAPRTVTEDDARSTAYRKAVRDEMAAEFSRIVPGTGPRI